MFGKFRGKGKEQAADPVEAVAEELFGQIARARDEAKSGGLIDEKVFNDRLNNMYVAGYLIGYVDDYLARLFDDDADKKAAAEQIFEKMFPGNGASFIKTRLIARQKAGDIPREHPDYPRIVRQCHLFDRGMSDAQDEVIDLEKKRGYEPDRLKSFLLLGEI